MKCPNCGRDASGRFCSSCGTSLSVTKCPSCGVSPPPGSRFCTSCGSAIVGASKGAQKAAGGGGLTEGNLGWWIAGSMMVLLIVIVALPIMRPNEAAGPLPVAAGAPAGGLTATDLANMPPREAADRLFNRVMTAVASNNTAEWAQFLPMAIQSYDMARPLDQDGLFHLSMLHSQNQDSQSALAVAQEGLETYPDHLLNLNAAAHAAAALGDSALAGEYYQRFLDVQAVEEGKGLPEYQAHANMFPEMRAEAEAFLGG
jgi:hypothetical protein